MKILIIGGAGFIGSHFAKYVKNKYPHYRIWIYDCMSYAGSRLNIMEENLSELTIIEDNILNGEGLKSAFSNGFDFVVNFAAETHVDRSIATPQLFVETNVLGTANILKMVNQYNVKRFLQVSTDEVYGSLEAEDALFTEETPLDPSSPYSASKAAADLLVLAYHRTYGAPVLITRCSNNYGSHQHPEKLIPTIIQHAIENKPIPLYGDGLNIRDWLFVRDHCEAIDLVLHYGTIGEVYNIGGNNERTNIEIVRQILQLLNKSDSLMHYVKDRPGHDKRYGIDAAKIRKQLGWFPKKQFEQGIKETVEWYVNNQEWVKKVLQVRMNGE